ncbi:DUF2577 domain-containing protein [Chengkuizengella sp. SCS-71B]|uniref:DUF2577 domain-containing protein n=1 Tax=Chengkuizengella sp. SCS-71B TaxID=3115290 RepID=UPI0032C24501
MIDLIKQASLGAVNASGPTKILYGTVAKINPLEINVDQRFKLPEDFLVVPESVTEIVVDLKHSHVGTEESLNEPIVIRKGLEVGDKVLLLRIQGGQQYIVLDRVVSS